MKRRSRAGGERTKGRRRKTPGPERGNGPKVQARAKLSPATEETEIARLTRELSEERKQRTATSEVSGLRHHSPYGASVTGSSLSMTSRTAVQPYANLRT